MSKQKKLRANPRRAVISIDSKIHRQLREIAIAEGRLLWAVVERTILAGLKTEIRKDV